MILVNKLFEDEKRALSVVEFSKGEHPLMVQLCGADSEMIKRATLLVDEYADVIDMNLGCPEPDVLALKAGCFFIKHPEQLKKCIPPVISNTNKPVTAKIRIGWDEKSINTVQVVKILEDFGVSAITVHPRTKSQSYKWKADWREIRKAKEAANVPIIGNGDILLPGNAKAMVEQTRCDGVMIARGAKGNPLIFKRTVHLLQSGKNLPEPTENEKAESFLKFAQYYRQQERQSFSEFRQHALWFTTGFKHAESMRSRIEQSKDYEQIIGVYNRIL
jgi:tRNA-dihydrouridine synthase B